MSSCIPPATTSAISKQPQMVSSSSFANALKPPKRKSTDVRTNDNQAPPPKRRVTFDKTTIATVASAAHRTNRAKHFDSIKLKGVVYTWHHHIASGSFGDCHLFSHTATSTHVVVKTTDRTAISRREISIHRRLVHPHIVALLSARHDAQHYHLVLEPCTMSLNTYRTPMSAALIRQLFAGALAGLRYIHDAGYVHRDLKLANLLICNRSCGADLELRSEQQLQQNMMLKICDFGVSAAVGDATAAHELAGTLSYLAPETIGPRADATYTIRPAIDVWSMAVCMYACWMRRSPFRGGSRAETLQRIGLVLYERRPLEGIGRPGGAALLALLERMLVEEDEDGRRPDVRQVLADVFFSGDVRKLKANVEDRCEEHFLTRCCHRQAISTLQSFLDPLHTKFRRSGAKTAVVESSPPVWMLNYVSYASNDDARHKTDIRLRYAMSDGRIAALFADRTITVQRNSELHHIDLHGNYENNMCPRKHDLFKAVHHEMIQWLQQYQPAPPQQSNDSATVVSVTGYWRAMMPDNVLVAVLSNQCVQVDVADRRFVFGPTPLEASEIMSSTDAIVAVSRTKLLASSMGDTLLAIMNALQSVRCLDPL